LPVNLLEVALNPPIPKRRGHSEGHSENRFVKVPRRKRYLAQVFLLRKLHLTEAASYSRVIRSSAGFANRIAHRRASDREEEEKENTAEVAG